MFKATTTTSRTAGFVAGIIFGAFAAFAAEPAYDTLIANRGESVDAPENTLPAYKMAVERGFGFECDVYLSKDGRVFTFHDKNLARTTGGADTRKCGDATWDELSKLDVGSWGKWKGSKFAGTRPALLEEVLELARDGRWIYIEVKKGAGCAVVPHIKKVLAAQKTATPKNVLFISFSAKICKALKEAMPEYKTLWIINPKKAGDPILKPENLIASLKELGVDGVDCRFRRRFISAGYIKAVRNAGFEFHVWTVDDISNARSAFRRGAQTVTTNCAKKLLDESKTSEEDRVGELLSRMTLEEKIGQLYQARGKDTKALEAEDLSGEKMDDPFLADIRAGRYGSLLGRRGVKGYNIVQKAAMESRLGIPLLIGHDLIHSARTCFPIPLALSCAWDEDLWERTGEAIAVEAPTLGCNWTFTPMLDISRDARWGRIAESAGQDPLVASLFGAAMVCGIQGENMADGRHIAACAKHYVAYGASLGGLDYNAVEMSDDTLRETYLPPFKAAVDAGVATIMPAFHSYNGVPCSINRYLLTDILRGEFGFDGMTISDCEAIDNIVAGHGVAEAGADVAAKALNAGMDMEMRSPHYENGIKDALKAGTLSMATVDEAVRRVLRTKFRLGLFEHPYIDAEAAEAAVDFQRNLALSREAAQKSTVLLKNQGLLPLKPGLKIALVGSVANDVGQMKGCWERGDFSNITNTTLLAGLKADGADVTYSQCFKFESDLDADALRRAAGDADVVVAAFGEDWGRTGECRSYVRIELNPVQLKALDILKETGKPVVAVLFCGRPLAVPELAEKADAVVLAWNPGGCGGWGVADVMTGVAEPYGRLTVDFPNATGECPKYYNRTTTGRPPTEQSTRYRTHYMDAPIKSVYPFGFGLAYTTFEYSGERAEVAGDNVVFSADVKNTGSRRGSEVVQVYVRDVLADTARPRRELKGFDRVWLEPGETKHVEIEVPVASLGYWVNGKYRVEPGDFDAWIAPHSDAGRKLCFSL